MRAGLSDMVDVEAWINLKDGGVNVIKDITPIKKQLSTWSQLRNRA
jgi:hypothetical protein